MLSPQSLPEVPQFIPGPVTVPPPSPATEMFRSKNCGVSGSLSTSLYNPPVPPKGLSAIYISPFASSPNDATFIEESISSDSDQLPGEFSTACQIRPVQKSPYK